MPALRPHVIGFCGFANTGKDTAADILVKHAGFRKLAFGDALRHEVSESFHVEQLAFTRREMKERLLAELALSRCTDPGYVGAALVHLADTQPGISVNEQLVKPRSPRETLQIWGTQYRRASSPGYWTRTLRDSIRSFMRDAGEQRFVVTDVRFEDEASTVRALGGQLWQITRPGINAATTTEGTHQSANDGGAFAPDAVISNDHDLAALRQKVLGEFWALDACLDSVRVEIDA